MTTYALVMIVKDAAADLPRTLAAARPYISSWTICDTGSTDGTQAMVREMLDGIPGTLYEDEWVNFGHNRTLALERARGTADYLLLMDADMAVTIDEGWEPDPAADAFLIEMGKYTEFSYRLPLLVAGWLDWHSVGAVHEYTAVRGRQYVAVPTDAVRVDMTAADRSSPEKFRWHAGMLEAALAEDPTNARTVHYLAQTYRCLGHVQLARDLYLRRAGMGGFAEEAYYSAYQAALLAPDWPTQAVELMAAWEMRPQRLEALHALVRGLNERSLHRAAYALASLPTAPCGDVLFVHRAVWAWGMAFERSIAAWWVGNREEARELNDRLSARTDLPEHIRLQLIANRAFSEVA